MADDSDRSAGGAATPVIFISYSHKDEPEKPRDGEVQWLSLVQSYLQPAVKNGIFDLWVDQHIPGGTDWDSEIERKLRECDIFILLVSANSMATAHIVDREIAIIRERQARGESVHLYPLLLTPTPKAALEKLFDMNLRPRDARPLSNFSRSERESVMALIADEIAEISNNIAVKKSAAEKDDLNNKQKVDQRVFAPDFAADRADGKNDALDITPDVDAFAQLICLEGTKPPLSIALFGSWGSGKTFFMERLLKRVAELTARAQTESAATPEARNASHRIIERVVQVRFNAWHYSDANLWASLTAEFFDQLRAGGAGQKRAATYEDLVAQVARQLPILEANAAVKADAVVELDRQLSAARRTAEETSRRLDSTEKSTFAKAAGSALEKSFNEHRSELEELGRRVYMDDLAEDITSFTEAARDAVKVPGKLKLIYLFLKSGTPAAWIACAGLLLLSIILAGIPFAEMTVWAVRIGQIQQWSIFPAVVAIATAFWRGYVFFKPILEGAAAFTKDVSAARKDLAATLVARESEVSTLSRKLEDAKAQSDAAKAELARNAGYGNARAPAAALRYLLYDSNETAGYEDKLGIVSRARRSFEKLNEIMCRAKDPSVHEESDPNKVPDRIVLYIDDLDRCTHKQVYDVLQAVHLLLALESFVVVVGVDVRWIEGAIANHFEAELQASNSPDNSGSAIGARRARSLEYLEKIFQIPFWLRPISATDDGTYGKFISYLVAQNKPRTPLPPNYANIAGKNETDLDSQIDQTVQPPTVPSENGEKPDATRQALERIVLSKEEYDLIQSSEIGHIVGKSPRAVKRFVNIYQLIRARRKGAELARFVGDGNQPPLFPAAILLLAVDVGQASDAVRLFREAISDPEASTIRDAFDKKATKSSMGYEKAYEKSLKEREEYGLDEAIKLLEVRFVDQLPLIEWRKMADEIRRYSFNDPRAA